MRKPLKRLPAEGSKDRKKLEAMIRPGSPRGAEKRELQEIDGGEGWGAYKNDGKAYVDFLGGTLHVWGSGQSERCWIELPSQSK
jgi:adenosylmethionine-8-amino-7-oxononanoate aminotransferase